MPLGPVFNAELLTTARRPRYYVIRFLYGLIILFQIYLSYESNRRQNGYGWRELPISEMARFGLDLFTTFAVVQGVVVLMLTPSLVGGAIADEKQRKTLHYLLTSELSSAEIVLGKLAARLLQVGILVALGLPVVSLIGLFGGIDFQLLLLVYAGTFTTTFFLSTASILVSVHSRRPREAISMIYALELLWLIVPCLIMVSMPSWVEPWPTIAGWINPLLYYVAATSPVFLLTPMASAGVSNTIVEALWGMGLQLIFGTLFTIWATIRLRPAYRNDGGRSTWVRKASQLGRKRSWFPRPDCGDDAMLWKETHVARTGGLTKASLVTLGAALIGVIGYSAYGLLETAVEEIWTNGYLVPGPARREFNIFLRVVSTGIYILWMFGIASSAASGLSSEREEDQWTSLLTTPLPGFEIIRAKMIGPVWGLRLVAYLLFLMWAVGLIVGSIHPVGLIACLVEFFVFTWFLTAIGTFFSLRARNSTRALASTIALMIFLNGGYLLCLLPMRVDTRVITAGSTPFLFAISLLSMQDFKEIWRVQQTSELVAACVIGLLFYGVAAAQLTYDMIRSFDTVVDRPDRSRQNRNLNPDRQSLIGRVKPKGHVDELV